MSVARRNLKEADAPELEFGEQKPELLENVRHGTAGDGRSAAGMSEESQAFTASEPARALTERLMEEVGHPELGLVNLLRRYETLKA